MRKFIVSDLHGFGNLYDSMMSFLENIAHDYEIMLFINGDLIDRGDSSARMLLDIKNRIENNISFPIVYLGGNHELMMYQAALNRNHSDWNYGDNWFGSNGGYKTLIGLKKLLNNQEIEDVISFISNLNIYYKFDDTVDDKNIVLVHAKCPLTVNDICDIKIKDNNFLVHDSLWCRNDNSRAVYFPRKVDIGNPNYFTIIGHTPVNHIDGYYYDSMENTLNIDGGCSPYVIGLREYNHFPLVEIDSNRLNILTFNDNNEIIYGNYFYDHISHKMDYEKLEEYRNYLNKELILKKINRL